VLQVINILSCFERNELIQIPENISNEEIIKFFTLTEFDLININKYRYNSSRLGFAIQICILRYKGWSLNYINNDNFPEVIINFIAKQLHITADINSFKSYCNSRNKNTLYDHFKAIKSLYKYNNFSKEYINKRDGSFLVDLKRKLCVK
jgi:TnpA family transposase